MPDYQPTDEQIEALCPWGADDSPDLFHWAMSMTGSPAFQAIIRAAQAEALQEARVTIEFADTVPNDGEYEYTSTGDCDGSNVRYLRRKPKYVGDYHPWEPSTEQAWAAAQYPNPADRIEAADV